MSPADILKWATLAAQLVEVLGVPIASIIRLFRDAGGTDEECLELIQKWAALRGSVQDRIAFLKEAIALIEA